MPRQTIEYAVVGGMREDYFITPAGEAHLHKMGGNALDPAVGARLWAEHVGIVSRVGDNYPQAWLDTIETRGIDTRGVKVIPGAQDTRTFYAYLSLEERSDTDPDSHFARLGQPLPPELADYVTSTEGQEDRKKFGPLAVRPAPPPPPQKKETPAPSRARRLKISGRPPKRSARWAQGSSCSSWAREASTSMPPRPNASGTSPLIRTK